MARHRIQMYQSESKGMRLTKREKNAYLDEASRVISVQIGDNEALLGGKLELGETGLQELEGGRLRSLLLCDLVLINLEAGAGIEGVVDGHEWVATAEGAP